MIAGVVIAVIVVIVVIILLIVLLPRCKRFKSSSNEGSTNEEFTEETITTLTEHATEDNAEEWHQTQDNPLFASENFDGDDDDDAFANAFEEQGFFDA